MDRLTIAISEDEKLQFKMKALTNKTDPSKLIRGWIKNYLKPPIDPGLIEDDEFLGED